MADSADERAAREALRRQPEPTKVLPEELLWLLDAPLFIDAPQVEAFYDAVLRPDYAGDTVVLRDSVATDANFEGGLTVGAGIPWFGKGEVDARASVGRSWEHEREGTVRVVSNAYRHLLALAMHYAGSKPDRLVLAHPHSADGSKIKTAVGKPFDLIDPAHVTQTPRALVFLDLLQGTKFMPTAVELEDGRVHTLFGELAAAQQEPRKEAPPKYPSSEAPSEERDKYWQWYATYFKDREALRVVEAAVAGKRISWIDFRVPLSTDAEKSAPFLHLHIVARGTYDTGVFAYNFIARGYKHGVRIVGTLKSEPDLNVLAIFDR